MHLDFTKYQGTGNDFIMINNFDQDASIQLSQAQIQKLCDRHFGIGADGLIILAKDQTADFKMIYYNSDGAESSMCGNGGRCLAHFAFTNGVCQNNTHFNAIDGLHHAIIHQNDIVELQMNDLFVKDIIQQNDTFILDTGSPHYVSFSPDNFNLDIVDFGKSIRYNETYKEEGINVNTARFKDDHLYVNTYERGVEGETLSCGTGVTAACIAASQYYAQLKDQGEISVRAKGGALKVRFDIIDEKYTNVWLIGPATRVYTGRIKL